MATKPAEILALRPVTETISQTAQKSRGLWPDRLTSSEGGAKLGERLHEISKAMISVLARTKAAATGSRTYVADDRGPAAVRFFAVNRHIRT